MTQVTLIAAVGRNGVIGADGDILGTRKATRRGPADGTRPLGVFGAEFESTRTDLPAGGSLLLYTDGLVEAREQPVDDGITALCSVLHDTLASDDADGPSAERLCTAAIERMGRGESTVDDVAVLVLRRPGSAGVPSR